MIYFRIMLSGCALFNLKIKNHLLQLSAIRLSYNLMSLVEFVSIHFSTRAAVLHRNTVKGCILYAIIQIIFNQFINVI